MGKAVDSGQWAVGSVDEGRRLLKMRRPQAGVFSLSLWERAGVRAAQPHAASHFQIHASPYTSN